METKTTAKDFFIYLGVIIGLYVSSVSFLMLAFEIINRLLPLAGEYYYGSYDSSIRSGIAALIIFFPAFIYVSYIANEDLKLNPEKKDIWIRRWMIFLTLFVAGLTIAIDLTTLIYRFLGAEDLTLRFFLKVFFVLAVAITVFKFVLNDLRRTSFEITNKIKSAVGFVSIIILAVIICGILIIGSPASQKAKSLDDQRVIDLSNIQNQIVYMHWQNKGEVPATLDALKDPISGYMLPKDPETNENYEYKMISKNSFELCATFKTVSMNSEEKPLKTYPYSVNDNWQHGAERTCFSRTIDENLYPINPKNRF